MLAASSERSTSLLAYSITLIILSTVAVIMRLISRRISAARFWWDDVLIVISLLDSYATYVMVFIDIHHGMGRHARFVAVPQRMVLLKMIYASDVNYPFSVSTIKLAILLFYLRLFGSRTGFRKVLYVTGALVISWFIGKSFTAPLQEQHCIDTNAYLIPTSVFNVTLDVWILALPLYIVWTLKLSSRRKCGLSGIFLLGAFTIGASIARTYFVFNVDLSDITWSSVTPINWSSVETSVGIISACLPTLLPVFGVLDRKVQKTTTFWRRLINRSKDLWYLDSSVRQKGETNPTSNEKMAAPPLSLGDVSWRRPNDEGFGYGDAFKENGLKHPSP